MVLKLIPKELINAKPAKKMTRKQKPKNNETVNTATAITIVVVTTHNMATPTVSKVTAGKTAIIALANHG